MARLLQVDENLVLLVGHEIADGETLLSSFRYAFAFALLAILLIGLGGGHFWRGAVCSAWKRLGRV